MEDVDLFFIFYFKKKKKKKRRKKKIKRIEIRSKEPVLIRVTQLKENKWSNHSIRHKCVIHVTFQGIYLYNYHCMCANGFECT
jgi:hypothetical protein